MKVLLTLAVLLVAVYCQSPSVLTQQECVAAVNSTQTAFCGTYWTYLVKNNTDLAAAAGTAQAQYNTNVAKIATPSAACQAALTAFACQSSLPRCGRYQNFGSVLQSRCDAVNTACNVTGFPTTGGFSGAACVANQIISVDGGNLVCFGSNTVALGAACTTNIFAPTAVVTTPVTVSACPAVSSCNATATNPTCTRPNNLGDACVSTCVTGTAAPGSSLACIGGTCQYAGKRHDYPCLNNGECLSNNCTSGKCYESPLFGPCTTSGQCRQNLYCDTKNNTCYAAANQGELCGFVQPNWSNVPCVAGYTCVRSDNVTARCVANAQLNQACADNVAANVYDAPLCAPNTLPTTGLAKCVNGLCVVVAPGGQGAACNATNTCLPTFTCQYPAGQTQGTCVTPSSVACDTVGGGQCNSFQRCTCGATQDVTGTCAFDTSNPLAACASQQLAIQQCLLTKCQTVASAFVPYDSYSCGATQCLAQVNAYFCCVKGVVGTNYVAPNGQPADPCITPSPTPGPTTTSGPTTTGGPTPTGTGTNTPAPGQSSKRSGAATVAVSFIAMILAVVAFL